MPIRHLRLPIALLLLTTLLWAGCSDDDSDPGASVVVSPIATASQSVVSPIATAVQPAGTPAPAPTAASEGGRGSLVSAELVSTVPLEDVAARLLALGLSGGASYKVSVYRVVYRTVDAHGAPTVASGALALPTDAPGPRPLLSYQHGTAVADAEAPSAGGFERVVGVDFATAGYVTALPDLLGLGASPGFHPYVVAEPSATAVVDMLRAARTVAANAGVPLSGQLFLVGYSEGGYATMAAQRALETEYTDEFTVTASAPMAGPYDLSGVMADQFTSEDAQPSPYYLPYAVLAYDAVYDLYADPSEIFVPPYDVELPALFDRKHSGGEINAAMPKVPAAVLQPALIDSFEHDPDDPLRKRLAENDVYDWTPRAPTRLYHCASDEQVPVANTQVAYARFVARGSTSVEVVDPLPSASHAVCAAPSLLDAKAWFDEFVK